MWHKGIAAAAEGEFLWLESIFFFSLKDISSLTKCIQFFEAKLIIWILMTLKNHTFSSKVSGYYLYYKDKNMRVS